MPDGQPRVLIADDDPSVGKAVTRLLSDSCDVLGHVSDIAALFEATRQLRPDVILLDFSLRGGMTVLEACRQITSTLPDVKIIVFTAHDDADLKAAAYKAGASGFVWKLEAGELLLPTIQAVVG